MPVDFVAQLLDSLFYVSSHNSLIYTLFEPILQAPLEMLIKYMTGFPIWFL
jgi:hypothetical protein